MTGNENNVIHKTANIGKNIIIDAMKHIAKRCTVFAPTGNEKRVANMTDIADLGVVGCTLILKFFIFSIASSRVTTMLFIQCFPHFPQR